jgi:succinate dehydrogenase / fumarate reductase, flavoprotein subunit
MYHQFMELADVDITAEPMEVGPTCHYMMGGVRVDPETAASTVPGLYAAGEVAAGLHGSNRLGGNSLGDLLVFGRRAGLFAGQHALGRADYPDLDAAQVEEITASALEPFSRESGPNPYELHHELQQTMQELVGIIRVEEELLQAQERLAKLAEVAAGVKVEGNRSFNSGWHEAIDLRAMLAVSRCITLAALVRQESRGGHTRGDYPSPDAHFGQINHIVKLVGGQIDLHPEPLPQMPADLAALFEEAPHP